MRRIVVSERSRDRDRLLHVEAPGCIVNIHYGLRDAKGRRVTRVDVIPDRVVQSGEGLWAATGQVRRTGAGVRVIEHGAPQP